MVLLVATMMRIGGDDADLIFVTNIRNYIRGEKNCHVEKFQLSILNLNNLWSFIEVKAFFVPNLCGEKSLRRKSVWRKSDKYEVCDDDNG